MPSLFVYLIRALRHSFPLIVLVTFLIEGMELVLGDEVTGKAMIVPTIMVYVALFQVILIRPARFWSLRLEGKDAKPLYANGVLFRSVGAGLLFSALLVIPPIVVVLLSLDLRKFDRGGIEIVLILAMIPWAGLLFPLLGTMLPAAAMGHRLSLRNILRAARRTWWRVMLQLGLIVLPSLAALIAFVIYGTQAILPLSHSPVVVVVLSLVEGIVSWLPFVLAVAILCRAYEQGYPAEVPAADPRPHAALAPDAVVAAPSRDPASASLIIHAPLDTPENR